MKPQVVIRRATLRDARGLNAVIRAVTAERKYLALVRGPTLRQTRDWMRVLAKAGLPPLLALDGTRIVGWCDLAPRQMEGFRHCAGLGMGLLPRERGRGLGARLLRSAVALGRRRGIEKIELQVYASNAAAFRLYRRHGFRVEGRRVRGRKLDGRYDDIIHMARFLRPMRRRSKQ